MASLRYKCIKCGTSQSSSSHPLIGTCNKGGGHEWIIDDGKSKRYKCIKCGTGQSGSHPLVGTCNKGGGHQWVEA